MTSSILLLLAASLAVAGAFQMFDSWPTDNSVDDDDFDHDLFDLRRSDDSECNGRFMSERAGICLGPLRDIARNVTRGNFDTFETREGLDHVCELLAEATTCIGELREECQHKDRIVVVVHEAMISAGGFVCSEEGKEAYLRDKECWKKPELRMAFVTCFYLSGAARGGNKCQLYEPMRMCLSCGVELLCSEDAANFVANLIHHLYHPAIDNLCQSQDRVARSILDMIPLELPK